MITFTMKVLDYNQNGSYSVEYVPDNKKCTPIKINVNVDPTSVGSSDDVLTILKNSSPQNYWSRELQNSEGVNHNILKQLVNTTHKVRNLDIMQNSDPVTSAVMAESPRNNQGTFVPSNQPAPTPSVAQFRSTPEQVAAPSRINDVQLRIAIQRVLQEMADNTV